MSSGTHFVSNKSDLVEQEASVIGSSLESEVQDSVFGEGSCGEPVVDQLLTIDFKPIPTVDTDYVQKKCCAFWEFLESREELKRLLVDPESAPTSAKTSSSSSVPAAAKPEVYEVPITGSKTAVSMLEIIEKQGLIDRTFEAKLPQFTCSLGSREYHEDETLPVKDKAKRKEKQVCTCRGVCKPCKKKAVDIPPSAGSPRTKKLNREMQEWDEQHPKSMEPPGHPPTFIHSVMQRCHPICKNRRREWKGKLQNTSEELLLERKPIADCFRRRPKKVFPNGPCPLFPRPRRVTVLERNRPRVTHTVRICQAPIDDTVDTPYLKYADLAKKLGAWDAVKACCAFCECGACCPCGVRDYILRDAELLANTRSDMKTFDTRVKHDYMKMRIMYDKI